MEGIVRQSVRVFGPALLGILLAAAPVNAGKPDQIFHPVDEEFVDDFLSAACGVEVRVGVTGHWIERTFLDADGNPVRAVNNYAFHTSFSSENGVINARDVGADRATLHPDGSVTVIVIGSVQSFSVPGSGRVYADVGRFQLEFDANGDLVEAFPLSGQHDPDQVSVICSILGD